MPELKSKCKVCRERLAVSGIDVCQPCAISAYFDLRGRPLNEQPPIPNALRKHSWTFPTPDAALHFYFEQKESQGGVPSALGKVLDRLRDGLGITTSGTPNAYFEFARLTSVAVERCLRNGHGRKLARRTTEILYRYHYLNQSERRICREMSLSRRLVHRVRVQEFRNFTKRARKRRLVAQPGEQERWERGR